MSVVYLGIGSNIERKKNIQQALSSLRDHYGNIQCSSVYETKSYGFEGDPFYNLVARFETREQPAEVKSFLRSIELQQDRPVNAQKFKPRTIDLDFLIYGDLVCDEPDYQLPREDVLVFSFVLEPLSELAPDTKYPGSDKTFSELWQEFLSHHTPVAATKIAWSPGKTD
ncbi:MAG TPA: 2-amino-4-hydroxy-6-hydroxymethyldihydropteridine diphosphokinase [Chromatiales bacterium]|nr:2-amino-4-hydroxy-6-hydroxymethyldihydropteridine diphosphokinase [Thiotrichales bacterium]HIP68914.1 2-amino-4-hydroxy-6-hydroxymethyldihydropteridine diphosphokinase [Chromatiales bacterium]